MDEQRKDHPDPKRHLKKEPLQTNADLERANR